MTKYLELVQIIFDKTGNMWGSNFEGEDKNEYFCFLHHSVPNWYFDCTSNFYQCNRNNTALVNVLFSFQFAPSLFVSHEWMLYNFDLKNLMFKYMWNLVRYISWYWQTPWLWWSSISFLLMGNSIDNVYKIRSFGIPIWTKFMVSNKCKYKPTEKEPQFYLINYGTKMAHMTTGFTEICLHSIHTCCFWNKKTCRNKLWQWGHHDVLTLYTFDQRHK